MRKVLILTGALMLIFCLNLIAQPSADTTKPKLLVVGTAHLDTQWRWTVKNSIEEYIPLTFRENYKLMDLYPEYVFSFEGAFRYMLMDEYYPDEFAKLKKYIDNGQWRVTGSWVDAVDVNIPSFESLVRHTLYGNGYFKEKFGKSSRDIYLPDCFGFGYALPSIANHCGLESFSTQKLSWGCWVGTPFDIGIWKGVDGSSLVCAVNPGAYVSTIDDDLSYDTTWINAAQRQGDSSGLYAAYHYFGTGDTGGSPDSASVAMLAKSMKSDGPLEVLSVGADDVVDLVKTVDRDKLPLYDGELIMTRHGSGCYTSQAAMKRWNRQNELMADAAERASVIADLYGGMNYPTAFLKATWISFLWHQFHDDLTGTSIPEAYEYSWNDEILALNRFSAVLQKAVNSSAQLLNTKVDGTPVIVYNPLATPRTEYVTATVALPKAGAKNIIAYQNKKALPTDLISTTADSATVGFIADLPPVGYSVVDVRATNKKNNAPSALSVSNNRLENEKYVVMISDKGEIESIFDKLLNKELLTAPLRYEILEDTPLRWPAWEVDFDDVMSDPLDLFIDKAELTVVENNANAVAVNIKQKTENSVFNTIVRLKSKSEIIEFESNIDWYEREKMLKFALSTTASNDSATYDIGLGVIKRGLNFEKRYEVPGQQWADLSANDGSFGVALLNDCKYGWDHPTPEKLRLTLIHTPGIAEGWDWVGDERSQDNGHHTMKIALQSHSGDWREGNVVIEAAKLNQPPIAFETSKHDGLTNNREYSLVKSVSKVDQTSFDHSVMINALKKAEASDEIVVRVRELFGQNSGEIKITLDRPILAAREINGQEEAIGSAKVSDGALIFSLTPYQPKAFAVKLKPAGIQLEQIVTAPVELEYNLDGISSDANRCDGDFDGKGNSLSGDLIPEQLDYLGLPFVFGPKDDGAMNVVACSGQQITLSNDQNYNHLYLLAASVGGPTRSEFTIDGKATTVDLYDYAEPIGRWNSRLSDGELVEEPDRIAPAYINRLPVGWYGSHRHTAGCENDIYQFTYLFLIDLKLENGAKQLTLPDNQQVRVVAATLAKDNDVKTTPTQPLYDQTHNSFVRIQTDSSSFAGGAQFTLSSPLPATDIYYTLDGTEPSVTSAVYREPVKVNKTSTIKARAIKAGYNNDYVASKTAYKLGLRDALDLSDLEKGVQSAYYEAEWEKLPDFDSLQPVETYITDTIAIPELARDEDYGLTFTGYVKVPTDGVYAFSINSDDGSQLYISDTLLVDNDGLHGDYEMTGLIGLKAGYHKFQALMFQCKGGEALGVTIDGPNLPKQKVSGELLYHKK